MTPVVYSLGLFAFWIGLIVCTVALFRSVPPGDTAYLVTDRQGSIFGGEFPTEDAAVALREELGAIGVECWVIEIERGSYTEEDGPC